jgi:hypothetical protein
MPRVLQIFIALGGAFYAWRAYAAWYERFRAATIHGANATKWGRIFSCALAVLLVSFVCVVAFQLRAPQWVVVLMVAAVIVALAGASTLNWRAARWPR